MTGRDEPPWGGAGDRPEEGPGRAPEDAPQRVLLQRSGRLNPSDAKTHLYFGFTVPPGQARLAVDVTYRPDRTQDGDNLITPTLLGPEGFRGAAHRKGGDHRIRLDARAATPGFLPGPLTPGAWRLSLDVHAVLPGAPCDYQLEVRASEGDPSPVPAGPAVAHDPPTTVRAERGADWYAGDLHCHTVHSDGTWTTEQLLTAARARGLDFLAITDHNTTAAHADPAARTEDGMLILPGMELTTFYGHALSLGTRAWTDWRGLGSERSITEVAGWVHAREGLLIMAHPASVGDPVCTGCDWRFHDAWPGPLRAVEVWNGPWDGDRNNPRALDRWYAWLRAGHHLVATVGTDEHGPAYRPGNMGFARVHAPALTRDAVLGAVHAGHLYASCGPTLTLCARSDGNETAMMGDMLPADTAEVEVTWSDAPRGATLRLVTQGGTSERTALPSRGTHLARVGSENDRWLVAELRDASGGMLAVTNPVFVKKSAGG